MAKLSANNQLLLRVFDESFDKVGWYGPNLRGSFRGLTSKHAAWRPQMNRHNVWENVVHCAYWKYVVRRRILKLKKGSFVLEGSNWFRRPEELSESAWRSDIALLEAEHEELRSVIVSLSDPQLEIPSTKPNATIRLIYGIAQHDVYHAGQIRLIRRTL
jgi:hypothetical protein